MLPKPQIKLKNDKPNLYGFIFENMNIFDEQLAFWQEKLVTWAKI